MSTNLHPLRLLRSMAGLSQNQLAALVGVDEQYVRRAEKGLVGDNTDLSAIITRLLKVINDRHLFEGRISTENAVRTVQGILVGEATRVGFLGTLSADTGRGASQSNIGIITGFIDDWRSVKRHGLRNDLGDENLYRISRREYKTFREFREEVCRAAGLRLSTYAFCEALALHPFIIQRYESEHRLGASPAGLINGPHDLRVALSAAGIDYGSIIFTGGAQ